MRSNAWFRRENKVVSGLTRIASTLQIAGLAHDAATSIRRDLRGGGVMVFQLASDGRLVSAGGFAEGNAVAKDIRISKMLIDREAVIDPERLADPGFRLRSLL